MMTGIELSRHFNMSDQAAYRLLKDAGVKARKHVSKLEAPADLAERALEMTAGELRQHYSKCENTIRRWLQESGIKAKQFVAPRKAAPTEKKPSPKGRLVLPNGPKPIPMLAGRDEDAAHYLRRFFPNVHHCNARGGADPKGKFWRVGMAIITASELVERAERKGWDPDAWQKVAA